MRLLILLALSVLFHLAVLGFDYSFFLPAGKALRAHKISYTERDPGAFVPVPVAAPPVSRKLPAGLENGSPDARRERKPNDRIPVVGKAEKAAPPPLKSPRPHKHQLKEDLSELPEVKDQAAEILAQKTTERAEERAEPELTVALPVADSAKQEETAGPFPLPDPGADAVIERAAPADGANRSTGQSLSSSARAKYAINPKPEYPKIAKMRGWEGAVLFDVLVLENGRVGRLKIVTSSGYKSLDNAARKALKRWRFVPAKKMGLPVESQLQVPIEFSLTDAVLE